MTSRSLIIILEGSSLKSCPEPQSLQRKNHSRKVSFFTTICQPINLYCRVPSPSVIPTVSPHKPLRAYHPKRTGWKKGSKEQNEMEKVFFKKTCAREVKTNFQPFLLEEILWGKTSPKWVFILNYTVHLIKHRNPWQPARTHTALSLPDQPSPAGRHAGRPRAMQAAQWR